MATRAVTVEETLAWEDGQRTKAGLAAIASAVLLLAGGILTLQIFKDVPNVILVDGLRDALGQQVAGGGLKTRQILFFDDHANGLIAAAILKAVGTALTAMVLGFLFSATKSRRPEMPMFGLYLGLVGPILVAVATVVLQVSVNVKASDFAGGKDFSTAVAHDALQGGALTASQIISQLALFAIALAYVVIALNAMRVGLLTRFTGTVGIIVGALMIFPVGSSLPIIQCFWLLAVGLLILQKFPPTIPPAWKTGRAEPWPSQQELREQREELARKAAERDRSADAPDLPGIPGADAGDPAAPRRKKKRKR